MKQRSITYLILPLFFTLTACGTKYQETFPKMAPITEAVFASGSIDPKDAFTLTSLYDGFILKSFASENDKVHKGQILFQLDNSQQHVQVHMAEDNLTYAKANAAENSPSLLQIKAQMDAARAKLINDSVTAARYQRLFITNSVSKQEYETAQLNYTSSLKSYSATVDNYKATERKLRLDADNSVSQLRNAVLSNQYYNLISPDEFMVYQVYKKQGELVRKGDMVAQLGHPDSIVITMSVDEGSIDKVELGQLVLVELNTQKNKTYEAHVTKIYPRFNDNTQAYKVEARFVKILPEMIAGTQLQANIITSKKDKALLIPRVFLIDNNKVLVMHGKKPDTTFIQTGIISNEWVEVLKGVSTQDKIVKPL
ncbi:MAG: HlyD family efflux transporter periplasmic adaptor subunit [Bacteroidota bacterium]